MCANIGVDPLASNKGMWAQLLGFGDFYYELGVQIVEACLATRAYNGGFMELASLRNAVQVTLCQPQAPQRTALLPFSKPGLSWQCFCKEVVHPAICVEVLALQLTWSVLETMHSRVDSQLFPQEPSWLPKAPRAVGQLAICLHACCARSVVDIRD